MFLGPIPPASRGAAGCVSRLGAGHPGRNGAHASGIHRAQAGGQAWGRGGPSHGLRPGRAVTRPVTVTASLSGTVLSRSLAAAVHRDSLLGSEALSG